MSKEKSISGLKMLTTKQETFCLKYVELGNNGTQAALAARYSPKTAFVIAAENLKKPKIIERISAIRKRLEDTSVMNVLERKQRLSEIGRARLSDFVEAGADGSRINIGIGGCQSAALEEVTSHTEYDDNGEHPTVITKIKLHDPIRAIAELNKMGGDYAPEKKQIDLNVDVRFVIGKGYQVIDSTAKELTDGK